MQAGPARCAAIDVDGKIGIFETSRCAFLFH
jgi:hypothetical protein